MLWRHENVEGLPFPGYWGSDCVQAQKECRCLHSRVTPTVGDGLHIGITIVLDCVKRDEKTTEIDSRFWPGFVFMAYFYSCTFTGGKRKRFSIIDGLVVSIRARLFSCYILCSHLSVTSKRILITINMRRATYGVSGGVWLVLQIDAGDLYVLFGRKFVESLKGKKKSIFSVLSVFLF